MLLDYRQMIDHFLDASNLAALIHHLFIIEVHFLCVIALLMIYIFM